MDDLFCFCFFESFAFCVIVWCDTGDRGSEGGQDGQTFRRDEDNQHRHFLNLHHVNVFLYIESGVCVMAVKCSVCCVLDVFMWGEFSQFRAGHW